MSTIPEVIAAKHCGMKILGLSLITNKVVISKEDTVHASHAEVLQAVEASGKNVEAIVKNIITPEIIGKYLSKLPKVEYKVKKISNNSNDNKLLLTENSTSSTDVILSLVGLASIAFGVYIVFNNRK